MFGMNKIGDPNIVYDGEPLSDHFIVKYIELPLLPTIDASTLSISGKPGLWFSSRNIETRKIVLHIAMLNDNKSRIDMMEKWMLQSDYLTKDKECKLELGGGYFVNAMLTGDTPIKRENGVWSETAITFTCFDPYIYGAEHEISNVFNQQVYIQGKQPVWPLIRIYNASSIVNLNNSTTGKTMNITVPSGYGNNFAVDMEKHICGSTELHYPMNPSNSSFFSLNPGLVTLNFNGAEQFNLVYREKYL